jgi:hypothetical protein
MEKKNVKSRETIEEPSVAELEKWGWKGLCKATDGCWVEPDGMCQHGCYSWLIVLGLI